MSSKHTKRCPNCGANNPAAATQCAICDTFFESSSRWMGKSNPAVAKQRRPSATEFDPGAGEDDLMIRGASSTPLGIALGLLVILALVSGLVVALVVFSGDDDPVQTERLGTDTTPSPSVSLSPPPTAFPTNTRAAPVNFPTTTPLPATYTFTPTEGPCIKTAGAGDTLYGLAQQCGHRHLSIVDAIVATNTGLDCDTCLREGQTVEIPWPTSTPGLPPTDTESETGDDVGADIQDDDPNQSASDNVSVAANEFGTPDALATFNVEPTLRPGLMWHTITEGETMISIASQYNADAKVLSDINPEVDFPQCDFSERFGGPNCSVILIPGERMRVPAPSPTPTLSPTPSGSETPTPSPTPTFNVPASYSPTEGAYFDRNSLVTLRWSVTGTLASNEAYLVVVTNVDIDAEYRTQTRDLFFVLPDEWQPPNGRTHEFEWTISIAVMNGERVMSTRETTAPRHFRWQGQ